MKNEEDFMGKQKKRGNAGLGEGVKEEKGGMIRPIVQVWDGK